MAQSVGVRPFTNGMRSPIVAPVTRGLLGIPLFLLATRTDKYFAWTIQPPLTAAVLGANYWTSAYLAILASRERLWAFGRISISVALVFAPITTAATFIHLDKFHLGTFYGWFWVLAYGVYPPMLGFLLYKQLKVPGGDPPRVMPLPRWVRATFAVHAAVLLPLGVALFVAPSNTSFLWPWAIPDLSARALSAWVLAFGVLAAHALRENDFDRVRVALLGYPVLVVLQAVALARYGGVVDWGEAGAWVMVAFLLSCAALGVYGYVADRRRTVSKWVEPGPEAPAFSA